MRIIVRKRSVFCLGNREVFDLVREKDLYWEIVKIKLIIRVGCIVEGFKKDIFLNKKFEDFLKFIEVVWVGEWNDKICDLRR